MLIKVIKISIISVPLITGCFLSLAVESALAQTTNQLRQLKKVGVPVIMPTYVPRNFRLIDFKFEAYENEKYGQYKATFKGPNNSCFEIEGDNGGQGAGETVIRQWIVNTRFFGKVHLEEAIFDASGRGSRSWLQANIFIEIGDGVNYFFYSGHKSNCNRISTQEASEVIKSFKRR